MSSQRVYATSRRMASNTQTLRRHHHPLDEHGEIPTSMPREPDYDEECNNLLTENDTVKVDALVHSQNSVSSCLMMRTDMKKKWLAWDSTVMILMWIFLFYVSSVMANIMNKQLVDDHSASPTMLTFWHISYALVIDWLVVRREQQIEHAKRPVGFWNIFRVFAPLSVFIVVGKFSTYLSFGYVSMSLTHTAKASEPIFNVWLAACLFGEVRPWTVNVSLIPIAAGVAIASISEISYNHLGFLAATMSAMAKVLQNIYTKRVMDSEHFSFFELHMWCAIASLIIMIPLIIYQAFYLTVNAETMSLVPPFFVCSTIQYLSSLSSYMLLSLVSHLSFTIVNTMKRLVIISSGMFYFSTWNVQNFAGVLIAIGGVFCYNMAKMKHDRRKREQKVHMHTDKALKKVELDYNENLGLLNGADELDDQTLDRADAVDP